MVWSWHGPQSSDTLIASSPLNLRLIPMIIIMFRCAVQYSAKAAVPGKRSTIGPLRFNCQLHQWWHRRHHNNHHDQVLMQLPSDPKPPVEEPMLPPEGSPTRFATPVHEWLKRPSFVWPLFGDYFCQLHEITIFEKHISGRFCIWRMCTLILHTWKEQRLLVGLSFHIKPSCHTSIFFCIA